MDEVLWYLGECWKDLGRPEQVQFDNARKLTGWGQSVRQRLPRADSATACDERAWDGRRLRNSSPPLRDDHCRGEEVANPAGGEAPLRGTAASRVRPVCPWAAGASAGKLTSIARA